MTTRRELASAALTLVATDGSTDALIGEGADASTVSQSLAYLTGFLLQALALHRGEPIEVTERFVQSWLRGDDGGGSGDREPRHPAPTTDAPSAQRDLP